MKLHEYQAKRLFASVGISIPRGVVAATPEEAAKAYETLKRQCLPAPRILNTFSESTRQAGAVEGHAFACNVKAQIHAGGRGKAGGVVVATSAAEAAACATRLLGMRLVTKQTGPDGLPVSAVLVDERIDVKHEWYLAVTLDRFHATPMVLASAQGGMDIEEVAVTMPKAIIREPIDIEQGLSPAQLQRIAAAFGCQGQLAEAVYKTVRGLWALYDANDASLIEINPLVLTADGRVLALDAKVVLDDNALFRHPDLAALRDPSQEHPMEYKASQIGISYVGLEGNIGCLVNGAGLAMATNDIIKLCGGNPANFLDVGGGANVEQVTNAFSIILEDKKVSAMLVNIFGGIMRCDWIAQGLLNATQTLHVNVPMVVRLQGTNVEEGRRLLREAKSLNLISVGELEDAARKVVELAG